MTRKISVVAAIIWNDSRDKVLIARRPVHLHKGGCWEFPGGKLESGEAPEDALRRELLEELALRYESQAHFSHIEYDYPEKSVSIDFYHVFNCLSEPSALEGQELKWLAPQLMDAAVFPEANAPVVEALKKLPMEKVVC